MKTKLKKVNRSEQKKNAKKQIYVTSLIYSLVLFFLIILVPLSVITVLTPLENHETFFSETIVPAVENSADISEEENAQFIELMNQLKSSIIYLLLILVVSILLFTFFRLTKEKYYYNSLFKKRASTAAIGISFALSAGMYLVFLFLAFLFFSSFVSLFMLLLILFLFLAVQALSKTFFMRKYSILPFKKIFFKHCIIQIALLFSLIVQMNIYVVFIQLLGPSVFASLALLIFGVALFFVQELISLKLFLVLFRKEEVLLLEKL